MRDGKRFSKHNADRDGAQHITSHPHFYTLSMNLLRFRTPAAGVLIALSFILPAMSRAQSTGKLAEVNGTVTDAQTGKAMAGVLVQYAGSTRRTETDANGHFALSINAGAPFRLEASKVGFTTATVDNIAPRLAEPTVVDFTMSVNGFRDRALTESATLQPLVAKSATFVVDHISTDEMRVPTSNVADMLAGKAAGVQLTRESGAPGADVDIRLRALSSFGRTGAPLFIVDGVALDATFPSTIQDIEALDIESIEVLKGGTAAALYGTRALDGVIAIRTNRGKAAAAKRPQFTLRNEIGRDFAGDWIDERLTHPYRVNANGQYINAGGQVVPRSQRVLQPNGIAENRYVDPTYNHSDQFFRDNVVNNQTFSVQQNSSTTNYNVAYSRNRQPGIVPDADGYTRQSVRVNIDQRIKDRLQVGVSAVRTSAKEEPASLDITDLLNLEPDVDLRAPDATGIFPYVVNPDAASNIVNPLVSQLLVNGQARRDRTLINGTASLRVLNWLTLDALASTDRATRREHSDFYSLTTPSVIDRYRTNGDSALNERYQYGVSSRRAWGALTGKLALRGESQYSRNSHGEANVIVDGNGVPVISSSQGNITTRGMTAMLGNTNIDYAGKYVADVAFRRERTSNAFGTRGEPSTFIRAGAAWLLNEESWLPFENLNLFKLRYSNSSARTVSLFTPLYVPIGTPASYGSKSDSRIEQEIGIDVEIRRLNASLTYAPFSAKGNVMTGYNLNVQGPVPVEGRINGSAIEVTLGTRLVESTSGFRWSVLLTGSRERARIAQYSYPCFVNGIQPFCGGASIGEIWGNWLATNKSELSPAHANSQSAFDINDEGFVVPVGAGNSWRDGKAKSLWGTTVRIDGNTYAWGLPITAVDSFGTWKTGVIGRSVPDFRFGWQNNIGYKGIHFYTQFTGQVGGQAYNNTKQMLYWTGRHVDVDQSSKPDELRKSVVYYQAVAARNSSYLKNFVEDATAIRLAEASAGYTLDARRFAFVRRLGTERIQLDLIGRNLFNIGGMSGVPGNLAFGNPLLNAGYPLARTFTFATALTF